MSADRSELRAAPGRSAEDEAAGASAGARLSTCLVVLGGEQFAIDVRHLREVMVVDKLTAVPGAPAFVRGVSSLRGEVLAILDVAPVLGLPPCSTAPGGKALVIEPGARQVAIVVDGIVGLETFDELSTDAPDRDAHGAF